MSKAIPKLLQQKTVRFLICGALTAAFNIILLASIIEYLNIQMPFWRNVANVVALEVSVLFSFWVYKLGVWTRLSWHWRKVLFRQIPLYHASISIVIALRSFVIFPILDWLGVQYAVNALIGIVLGSALNYVCSDRFVFKE